MIIPRLGYDIRPVSRPNNAGKSHPPPIAAEAEFAGADTSDESTSATPGDHPNPATRS
jgi:hypothetical protein